MGEQHYPLDFTPQCPHLNWMIKHLDGWQFGEQGLIPAILEQLGELYGMAVEYGAGDGETLPLIIDRLYAIDSKYTNVPSRCHLVETDQARQQKLKERYPKASVCESIEWGEFSGDQIAVVVIDIDGQDSVVMRQMLAAGVRPTLLVVEHMDRHFPIGTSAASAIPQWMLGMKLESGHAIQDTAETLHAIATANGYERIGFNRCNSFFVVKERFAELFR